jgi:hypothetical protein
MKYLVHSERNQERTLGPNIARDLSPPPASACKSLILRWTAMSYSLRVVKVSNKTKLQQQMWSNQL